MSTQVDLDNPDFAQFPLLRVAIDQLQISVTVTAGDLLYIPTCWWHHIDAEPDANTDLHMNVNYWYTQRDAKGDDDVQREQYEEEKRCDVLALHEDTDMDGKGAPPQPPTKCRLHGRELMVCAPCRKALSREVLARFPYPHEKLMGLWERQRGWYGSLESTIKNRGQVMEQPPVKLLLDSAV